MNRSRVHAWPNESITTIRAFMNFGLWHYQLLSGQRLSVTAALTSDSATHLGKASPSSEVLRVICKEAGLAPSDFDRLGCGAPDRPLSFSWWRRFAMPLPGMSVSIKGVAAPGTVLGTVVDDRCGELAAVRLQGEHIYIELYHPSKVVPFE